MARSNLSFFIVFCTLSAWLASSHLLGGIESRRLLSFHFDKIEVKGAASVFVEPGKRNRQIEYFADSSIIDEVHIEVRNRVLFIDANNTYSLSRRIPLIQLSAQRVFPVEVVVSTDQVDEILLEGQSSLTAKNLTGEKLKIYSRSGGTLIAVNCKHKIIDLRHEGSGNIILKGRETMEIKAKVYGSGSLLGEELFINRASVWHGGTGQILLAPTTWLDLKLRGQGDFHLLEKPNGMVVDQGNASGKLIYQYE